MTHLLKCVQQTTFIDKGICSQATSNKRDMISTSKADRLGALIVSFLLTGVYEVTNNIDALAYIINLTTQAIISTHSGAKYHDPPYNINDHTPDG